MTVNLWWKSSGNRFWFELAQRSSWRGFELSEVNCMTRHASCCVPLCAINFKSSPGLAFYRIPKTRRFFSVVLAPRQRINLWSFFTVHSSGFSRGKIAHDTYSVSFFFSIPLSPLLFWAVLTPLEISTSLSDMFVHIRVPPNNPTNARAPSFGSRLSLFPEVSY